MFDLMPHNPGRVTRGVQPHILGRLQAVMLPNLTAHAQGTCLCVEGH